MESIGTIHLSFQAGLQFQVDFGLGEGPGVTTDAAPPLGSGHGPDSERLLMAAVANCLSASLVFALRKFRNADTPISTRAQGWLERNDQGRLRMHSIAVDIHLGVPASSLRLVERAIDQFEDFCVVTQSVRAAFPVVARVFDSEGVLLTGTGTSV